MLQILILTALLASILFAGCNYRNAIKSDGLAPNVIPKRYYFHYYRDWFLAIVVLVAVGVCVGLLLNAI